MYSKRLSKKRLIKKRMSKKRMSKKRLSKKRLSKKRLSKQLKRRKINGGSNQAKIITYKPNNSNKPNNSKKPNNSNNSNKIITNAYKIFMDTYKAVLNNREEQDRAAITIQKAYSTYNANKMKAQMARIRNALKEGLKRTDPFRSPTRPGTGGEPVTGR